MVLNLYTGPLGVCDLFTLEYDETVIFIEPIICPNKMNAIIHYAEMCVSVEDVVAHQ
jgi:hypothetical protein